jgi:hypothetical protein
LPLGGASQGDVFDLNEDGQMVGGIQTGTDWHTERAVRWPGVAAPIDLNTRLHRAPAGLHLYAGAAINGDGAILAHSNAGLVLLRPGKRGTDAPVLGPLQGLPAAITVGDRLRLKLGFTDNAPAQTHKVSIDWADGCPASAPVVREWRGGGGGVGEASLDHTFCSAGFYGITARVSDSGGRSTVVRYDVYVDDPAATAVAGRGTLAGAGAQRPLQFALWAPLTGQAGPQPVPATAGRAQGTPYLELAGPFHFKSGALDGVQHAAGITRLSGDGALNGRAGYRFTVEAVDGGGTAADRMRVRVSHRDLASKAEVVDYDSAIPAAALALGTRAAATGASATTAGTAKAAAAAAGPVGNPGLKPLASGGITVRN